MISYFKRNLRDCILVIICLIIASSLLVFSHVDAAQKINKNKYLYQQQQMHQMHLALRRAMMEREENEKKEAEAEKLLQKIRKQHKRRAERERKRAEKKKQQEALAAQQAYEATLMAESIESYSEEYTEAESFYQESAPSSNQSAGYSTPEDLKTMGEIYDSGWRYTWYSENVLPGGGLDIPGRYSDGNFVRDGDGNLCVASSDLPQGTIVNTPWGTGKVYDSGCDSGTLDMYVSW